MPTLFLLAAKTLTCRELEKQMAESLEEDKKNIFGLHLPRDIELATLKRSYLNELNTTIEKFSDFSDDKAASQALLSAMIRCKTQVTMAATEKKQPPAQSEKLLDRLNHFVKKFYQKSLKLKLLNQMQEPGSFNIFLKATMAYYADRAFEDTNTNMLISIFSHPSITCTNAYNQLIDTIVDDILIDALDNLAGQNQDDARFSIRKEQLGIRNIEYLILKNAKTRSEYTYTITNAIACIPATLDTHLSEAHHSLPLIDELAHSDEIVEFDFEELNPDEEMKC